jgi:sigma-54 dependent transcriptional regulator, acetoin dehydrogenase operon transcriptional activator AcoR
MEQLSQQRLPHRSGGHGMLASVDAEVGTRAEEHLFAIRTRDVHERTAVARLATAAQQLATIVDPGELIAKMLDLALVVCPGSAVALVDVASDGVVEVVARRGAPFRTPQERLDVEARLAAAERIPYMSGGCSCDEAPQQGSRQGGRRAMIPLRNAADGLVLALECAPTCVRVGGCEMENVVTYASLADVALARARAGTALQEADARDAATLGAIRDGVVAMDAGGVVRALNPVAAAVLGVRPEDVVGRHLREVPALAPVARAIAGGPGPVADVVTLPRGEVVLRAQKYDGGLVAVLRDVAPDRTGPQRVVGSVTRYTFDQLVGAAPSFLSVVEDAKRVARADIPVLIRGESGTGKEMLAQAIHNASPRSSEPFLGINVTAIPRELLESELFGYEGGAFTGARAAGRAGKFELAGRGTLLLDEIGDMPLEMQSQLLRVLQERVVQRLGSARDIPVRARIIATTHRDLLELVNVGRFRLDLYHRLCVLPLCLPPLRERMQDVPLLIEHELRLHAKKTGRSVRIAPHVLAALERWEWRGNVRKLRNVIEGELSVLPAGEDMLARIPPSLQHAQPRAGPAAGAPPDAVLSLAEMERRACEESLAAHKGNVARAARALGVAKGTLYSKMKRYGIGAPKASGS